ncbi:MAG: hypothetical protein V1851_02950 [Patescibacteria group bacterium]
MKRFFIIIFILYYFNFSWNFLVKPYFYVDIESVFLDKEVEESFKLIDFIEADDLSLVNQIFSWDILNRYTLDIVSLNFLSFEIREGNFYAPVDSVALTGECLKNKTHENLTKEQIMSAINDIKICLPIDKKEINRFFVRIEPTNKLTLSFIFVFVFTVILALFLKSIDEIKSFFKSFWF